MREATLSAFAFDASERAIVEVSVAESFWCRESIGQTWSSKVGAKAGRWHNDAVAQPAIRAQKTWHWQPPLFRSFPSSSSDSRQPGPRQHEVLT